MNYFLDGSAENLVGAFTDIGGAKTALQSVSFLLNFANKASLRSISVFISKSASIARTVSTGCKEFKQATKLSRNSSSNFFTSFADPSSSSPSSMAEDWSLLASGAGGGSSFISTFIIDIKRLLFASDDRVLFRQNKQFMMAMEVICKQLHDAGMIDWRPFLGEVIIVERWYDFDQLQSIVSLSSTTDSRRYYDT
uniref:Uncharacterized protein n=1 Tax=Romanomermis culicivorax TaxID=13658 RepID=A0A915IYW4_ROMCU